MNQEEALNLVKRCNELCDQREELTHQRNVLLAACERAYQRLLEMGQQKSHRTLKILKAAIASVQKAEEIR